MTNAIAAFIAAMLSVFGVSVDISQAEQAVRGAQVQLTPPPPAPAPEPVRPEFDGASRNGVCVGAIPLLEWYSPGWDVNRMAAIMYRESRCQPGALYPNRSVSTATGLLQILATTHCPWISRHFGVQCDVAWLQNPHNNVMAGAELYRRQGISAWAQTS